ncbi:MAG: DUF6483 family protein [Clostridiales bacterium]
MYNRDYILLLIEQFGLVLKKIFFHVENKEYDKALDEIDLVYKELLGVDGKLIRNMSDTQISQYLNLSGSTQFEKSLVIAELLKIEAEIEELQNGFDDYALDKYLNAFYLFVEAFESREELRMERFLLDTDQIISKVKQYIDSDYLKYKLFVYFEIRGCYAKSEDVLFELIDENYPDILSSGKAFYKRLLDKTDEDLINGNLPREEVHESLSDIESKLE